MAPLRILATSAAAGLAACAAASSGNPVDAGESGGTLATEQRDEARRLFRANGCFQCHTLADAKAAGTTGPSFDKEPITRDLVIDRVTYGRNDMPGFGLMLSPEEIELIADYLVAMSGSPPDD